MHRRKAQVLAGLCLIAASWTASMTPLVAQAPGASATAGETLPKDVFPETRNRLALVKRVNLDERRAKAYDAAAASAPSGVPQGVAAMRLHASGADIRWASPLGRALTELVILTTARELDQPYEWSVHEMEAVSWGLDPKAIELVRNRKSLRQLDAKQALAVDVVREIVVKHKLSSETYALGLKRFGEPQLVDIVSLTAMYAGTAARLTAFNTQLPAEMKQLLPLPFTPSNDIHADSRARLPLKRSPPLASASLYSREIAPAGTGPNLVMAHQAGIKSLEAHVGRRLMGLAGLVTAREYDSQYDWTVTELAARSDGLEPAIIDVVRDRGPVNGLGEKESVIIEFGRELFAKHNVSAQTYARAKSLFGETDLVDLVNLMGQHVAEASYLAAFDQQLPAGQRPLLPVR